MKCKSWSNKINNFVVRRLKSIKINGQQQQQQQQSTAAAAAICAPPSQHQQQQQHQYLSSTCSTMPAMPKEKAATAVSLNENNFSELKLKELATSAAVVVATAAAMATTASAAPAATATNVSAVNAASRLQTHHSINSINSNNNNNNNNNNSQHYQQQQQYAKPQQRSTCGCGAASAVDNGGADVVDGYRAPSSYWTNGYSTHLSSPLAVAASEQTVATGTKANTSPQRSSNAKSCACNRSRATAAPAPAPAATPTTTTPAAPGAVTPPKKSANDFIFGKYIGEGSFSTVYLAVDINTKREYAIKVCDKRHILREVKQEYVRREREVMHKLTNVPGFVNLSCTFQDHRSLYFVMTYAKNGDLLPYISRVGSFYSECTRHYAAELVLACEQMHRLNIVHRDLKPENILFDEDMHTLIADFGSAKILTEEERAAAMQAPNAAMQTDSTDSGTGSASGGSTRSRSRTRPQYLSAAVAQDELDGGGGGENEDDDTGSDDVDSPSRQPRYQRKRRGSFVGTAQYVSPEVLQNGPITPAADLWALGCIIYQMVSGLPPFRASTDYVIFKQILACKLDFPEGFDKDAEDLVRKLLKVNPHERLGAQDEGDQYTSIRSHPFFAGVNFDTVRQQTPPAICPYLPGVSKDESFQLPYHVLEHLEPGLDDKQLTRLLGMELGTALGGCEFNIGSSQETEKKTETKNIFDLTDAEKQKRLEQQKSDKWHVFADNEVILKKGYINKRKGLFARRRMLLLTTGPRLIYIDPVQMIKKGEIPWSAELHCEPKNFKIFFVHTPNRTYYLEDPEGYALEWNDALEKMRLLTYSDDTAAIVTAAAASASLPSTTTNSISSNGSASTARRGGNCSSSAVGSVAATGGTNCATTTHQVKTA